MRESGYYWVKDDEGWHVAYFYRASGYSGWRATNCETDFYDDDWLEIDERRIERTIAYTHADNQDHNGSDRTYLWLPLADDGDALRLAHKLRINIDFKDCCAYNHGAFGVVAECWGGDYHDCYRSAIFRAAAEIGKAME